MRLCICRQTARGAAGLDLVCWWGSQEDPQHLLFLLALSRTPRHPYHLLASRPSRFFFIPSLCLSSSSSPLITGHLVALIVLFLFPELYRPFNAFIWSQLHHINPLKQITQPSAWAHKTCNNHQLFNSSTFSWSLYSCCSLLPALCWRRFTKKGKLLF